MQSDNQRLLIIFAKGKGESCKTRLGADIGVDKAIRIYYQILEIYISKVDQLGADFDLIFYVQGDESWFQQKYPSIPIIKQPVGDLGQKMKHVFNLLTDAYDQIIISGSDCPIIDWMDINDAFEVLESYDAVIGPANDGGYYLLGLNRILNIFERIDWGTSRVLDQTLKSIEILEKSCFQLSSKRDIDTQEDLDFYIKNGWIQLSKD
tara:strand:+ start:116 stop:736 length:621 start_codon:yes stop_codon:yes gene_type:complete